MLMNKVILMGRLTRNPDVRYTTGENAMAIARYSLAVDRRGKKSGDGQSADFINCVAFGRQGEFAEKYLRKGMKMVIVGRIQTGSYISREGQKVFTTDIVVEEQEFAESKKASQGGEEVQRAHAQKSSSDMDGFMEIPDGIEEELPFI